MKKFSKYGSEIDKTDINKLLKEMCINYGKLFERYNFKFQVITSAEYNEYD